MTIKMYKITFKMRDGEYINFTIDTTEQAHRLMKEFGESKSENISLSLGNDENAEMFVIRRANLLYVQMQPITIEK